MIRPESKILEMKQIKFKRYENDGKNTNLLMRMSTGWLSERYSTTIVHKYWGSQLSGNFSIIPPSAIGL